MAMLDAKLQADADAALDVVVTALRSLQSGVRGSAGRYRQLRRGDNWGAWEAHKPDPDTVVVRVDEYLAPGGPGYTVTGEVVDSGLVWHRTIHVAGPETWREHGWEQYDPETI